MMDVLGIGIQGGEVRVGGGGGGVRLQGRECSKNCTVFPEEQHCVWNITVSSEFANPFYNFL